MKVNRFLYLLMSVLLLSSACSGGETPGEPEPASSKSGNYLSVMPKESSVLFYANLENLRNTTLGTEMHSEFEDQWLQGEEDEDYREFVAATGIDPEKDLHEIWGGLMPGDEEDDSYGGAVLRGKFDEDKIVAYMKSESRHEIREREFLGHTVYVFREGHEKKEHEMAFLNSDTILLGSPAWFERALSNYKDKGDNVLDNAAMAQYIKEVPHKDQLWCIIDLEGFDQWANEVKKRGSAIKNTESIENMKSIVFSTDIDDRARVFLTGNFGGAEEADLVAEMLTGFKAMAKLMMSDDRDAIDMINDIKIKTDGATLHISTNFDKETIEKVQEKRRNFSTQQGKLL